jgi:Xaa-Pro aminopeptidase
MDRIKTADQITAIETVQRATEKAMDTVISYLKTTENPTSDEAHKIIDEVLEKYDCESPEGHIVASGIQSAEPHEKGAGPIKKRTPIVIDIFPRSKTTGYFADMSRTVCVGEPSPELQRMYDAVCTAQDLAISLIKPKTKCSDIQTAVEKLFSDASYVTSGKGKEFHFAEGFVHSVGHGVGLKIHEAPVMGRASTDVLEVGDVVTIEPALYYKNIGGVRLEDLLVVTENGSKNLTNFPRQLKI